MRLLLDTHIFLWYISGDDKLPLKVKAAIQDTQNDVYLSVVSVWESIIKYQLGKLPLPLSPEVYLPLQRQRHQISSLAVEEDVMIHLASLPLLHRDPFDRILICQALMHNLTLATVDASILGYPVTTFNGT